MGKWPSSITHHRPRRPRPGSARHDNPPARWRGAPARWLFEVGGAEPAATARYLKEGYRVLCIEADPRRAARLAQRFGGGACTVLNVAVATAEGSVPFLVRPPGGTGHVDGSGRTHEICVRARTLASIFGQFGVPYLLKVNSRQATRHVILALSRANAPKFVTFQAAESCLECLLHLHHVGFQYFNMSIALRAPRSSSVRMRPSLRPASLQSFRDWLRLQPGLRVLVPPTRPAAEPLLRRLACDDQRQTVPALPVQVARGWRDIKQALRDVAYLLPQAADTHSHIELIASRGQMVPRAAVAGAAFPRAPE
jgi:hypothetical protein